MSQPQKVIVVGRKASSPKQVSFTQGENLPGNNENVFFFPGMVRAGHCLGFTHITIIELELWIIVLRVYKSENREEKEQRKRREQRQSLLGKGQQVLFEEPPHPHGQAVSLSCCLSCFCSASLRESPM